MSYIKLGNVRPFPNVKNDKAQALKPLEEAAEVLGAWQEFIGHLAQDADSGRTDLSVFTEMSMSILLDEIADTITASCNLAAALGVTDLTPYLARCEERNRKRGRYDA